MRINGFRGFRTPSPDAPLRPYDDWRPDTGHVVKLARFPIGQPDASMGGRLARQITLVQSVTRGELQKVGHRSADEVRMRRAAVASAIDVGLNDSARGINVVAVETGAMIDIFAGDPKATDRSPVSLSTTRYPGRRDPVAPAIKIGFLRLQAHSDRRSAGVPIRHIRLDHFSHGAAAAQGHKSRDERVKF